MVAEIERAVSMLNRRTLIKRLAAAGFASPVIAAILADGAWAQDAATPAAEAFNSPFTTIPPDDDPAASLASIGVDQPLIPHGGFNFGTPPELVTDPMDRPPSWTIRRATACRSLGTSTTR